MIWPRRAECSIESVAQRVPGSRIDGVSQSRRTLWSGEKCGNMLVVSGIVTIRSLEVEEGISLTLYHPPEKVNFTE